MTNNGNIDHLLRPTLRDNDGPQMSPSTKPWRQNAQFFVAFFGGALAYITIALINGRRLNLSKNRMLVMLSLGVLALVLTVLWSWLFPLGHKADRTWLRLSCRITNVVLFLICSGLQRSAERVYHYRFPQAGYASLLVPGFAASTLLQILQFFLMYGVFVPILARLMWRIG